MLLGYSLQCTRFYTNKVFTFSFKVYGDFYKVKSKQFQNVSLLLITKDLHETESNQNQEYRYGCLFRCGMLQHNSFTHVFQLFCIPKYIKTIIQTLLLSTWCLELTDSLELLNNLLAYTIILKSCHLCHVHILKQSHEL